MLLAFATTLSAALLSGHTASGFAPSRLGHAASTSPLGPSTTTSLYLGDFFNFGKKEEEPEVAVSVEEPAEDEGYYDEDDPIEKIFGFFFGKKETAPMGYVLLSYYFSGHTNIPY